MTWYSGSLPQSSRRFTPNDGHAVAATFHEVLPVLRSPDTANRQARQYGGQRFVACDLAGLHAFHGEVVGQRAGRLNLQAVGEHREANLAAAYRVVAVHDGVDEGLKQRPVAVLGKVNATLGPCGRQPAYCVGRRRRPGRSAYSAGRRVPARRSDRTHDRSRGSGLR